MSTAALVKFDEAALTKPLGTIQEFSRFCEDMKGRAFVLSPITHIDHIPDIFQISRRVVFIDPSVPGPNESGPECYHSALYHGSSTENVSLGKTAILKLLAAAGASPIESVRTDDRSNPHYCEFRVVVAGQDFDGVWRQMPGTKALDFRDGSEDAKAMKPNQLNQARRHILRQTETKALEAATRAYLSLPHKFKASDLKRMPFIVPKLILRADHPAVTQHLIQNSMGMQRALYGAQPEDQVRMLKDVTPAGTPPPALPAPAVTAIRAAAPQETRNGAPAEMPDDSPSDDFDLPDFNPPPAPVQLVVCGCSCGCQRELTPEIAEQTTKAIGAPRCGECFPAKRFSYEKHKGLRNLGLPGKNANLTANDVMAALDRQAKAK